MLRYCGVIAQRDARPRLGGLDGVADLLQQLAVSAQSLALEIAQDEVQLGLGGVAVHHVEVDEALAAVGRLRRQRHMRQRHHDLRGEVQSVDQHILGLARGGPRRRGW